MLLDAVLQSKRRRKSFAGDKLAGTKGDANSVTGVTSCSIDWLREIFEAK